MRFSLTFWSIGILLSTLLFSGCDQNIEQKATTTAPDSSIPQNSLQPPDNRVPPKPPISETFDGQPQLSLFPRVGDYQPERDEERFPFWKTFIDHFNKVSGLVQDPESKNKAWSFRGIKSIDSVAFFTPLAVEPNTTYLVSYKVKTELPEGAKTGIGVLEFNKFLWVGEQYTEQINGEYLVGSRIGVELTGSLDWEMSDFAFTTAAKTKMIHLVFYREGEHSRKPVFIDDVEIVQQFD